MREEVVMRGFLSILAGLLPIIALVPYARGILKGKTKPVKASWMVWSVVNAVTMASMYDKGVVNGQIIGSVVGCLTITFLTFWYGVPGWTKLDKFCLGGAAAGIIFWQMSGDALYGMVIALTVATIGSIPTFVSAWEDYRRENKLAWVLVWFSSICVFGTISEWSFTVAIQPVVFFMNQSILMYILFVRPKVLFSTV